MEESPEGLKSLNICILCCAMLTLCDPIDYSLPGSSVHGDSLEKNTGVGCHLLFQEIFPTQGLNPGLPHCRQTLYYPSHKGSPKYIYKTEPGGSVVKNLPAKPGNARDADLMPGSGRVPGEGNGNPLHYSCLQNPH